MIEEVVQDDVHNRIVPNSEEIKECSCTNEATLLEEKNDFEAFQTIETIKVESNEDEPKLFDEKDAFSTHKTLNTQEFIPKRQFVQPSRRAGVTSDTSESSDSIHAYSEKIRMMKSMDRQNLSEDSESEFSRNTLRLINRKTVGSKISKRIRQIATSIDK